MNQSLYNKSAVSSIASILSSVTPADRNRVAREAVDLAYGSKELTRNLLPQIIPSEASIELTNNIINGTVALLKSVGEGNGDTTLRTVMSRAKQSYGEAKAFQGSPDEIGTSTPIAVAAALNPEELAPNMDEATAQAVQVIAKKYDCLNHHLPLGGCAMGPVYWDQVALAGKGGLKKAWNWLKGQAGKVADSVQEASNQLDEEKKVEEAATNSEKANAILTALIPVYAQYKSSDDQIEMAECLSKIQKDAFQYSKLTGGNDIMADLSKVFGPKSDNRGNGILRESEYLDNIANQAKEEIESAMQQMTDLVNQQSQLKEASQQLALNLARLSWAKAALGASDDVALLMTMAAPDMNSVSAFIATAINTMAAARKTGSVSNMSALVSALKMGFSNGGLDTSTFDALFGNPEIDGNSVEEQVYGLPVRLS